MKINGDKLAEKIERDLDEMALNPHIESVSFAIHQDSLQKKGDVQVKVVITSDPEEIDGPVFEGFVEDSP